MHGGEIAFRRDREAGFDDVDTHSVEEFGDLELLLMRHGRAGALLAVAQGSVEDDDAVLLGLCLGSHWFSSFSIRMRHFGALLGFIAVPPSAQAHMPSRPSGADKEKERAQNKGSRSAGVARRPLDRANFVARRHDLWLFPRLDGQSDGLR